MSKGRNRKWRLGGMEHTPTGQIYDIDEASGWTVAQVFVTEGDTKAANIILEAPEAVRACTLMSRALDAYGSSQISDLFGHDEAFTKALRLLRSVAASYKRGTIK